MRVEDNYTETRQRNTEDREYRHNRRECKSQLNASDSAISEYKDLEDRKQD